MLFRSRYKVKVLEETSTIHVYNGDVIKSDTAVPSSLKDLLRAAVAPLEDIPERKKDWHPGSDKKVLDLVHPSLFPLVYGRTRILPDTLTTLEDCVLNSGSGKASVRERHPTHAYSTKFQWLPCDVDVRGDGVQLVFLICFYIVYSDFSFHRITSYINNLHPQKHRDLYSIIENIIGCVIPLWNKTLTGLKYPETNLSRTPYKALLVWPKDYDYEELEKMTDAEYEQRRKQWYEDNWLRLQPEPAPFQAPEKPAKDVDLRRDYAGSGLQIIVKLANIELTPENPTYDGGSWHVEGMLVSSCSIKCSFNFMT